MRNIAINKTDIKPLTHLRDNEIRFKERVRDFAQTHVAPLVAKMDEQAVLDASLVQKLFEFGLMGIDIPSEFSGANGTFFDTIIANEELSMVDPAIAVFIDVQNTLVNNAINRWGNDAQKKYFLPLMARNTVGSFSITEKEAGSDAFALGCSAKKVSSGYLLTGEKHWATNAAEADVFIIFAKAQSEKSNDSLTAFLVDKKTSEGFRVEKSEEKMGIRASSTCDLTLNDVFVPEENVLGSVGRGRRIALETLTDGRIGIAAQMLGLAQGVLDAAVKYSQKRKQFGKYIASFQGIHFPLAEIATDIEAARLLVYNAARLKMVQNDFGELFYASSMAKLFASQVAEAAASKALDIVGGVGYMKGSPVEKFYRDAKIGKTYEGTINIQLRSIARKFLKVKIDDFNS